MAFPSKDPFEKFPEKIWLSSPTMHGEELVYITQAYRTNWMSTVGENINEVECIAAEQAGMQYAVGLSCCTAALHLAVRHAGEALYGRPAVSHGALEGKRVFCSDMTFDATLNPVVYEGGIPVFIDTEADSWNMDPAALEKAFDMYPDVRLVVSAELYGFPGRMDVIKEICEKHGALLIEDAAEAMGATVNGRPCGSFGDYSAISYNGNKIITGSAGGCLLTNDVQVANKVRKWSTQARENAPWYQHEEVGYNYRMSNVVAGVARVVSASGGAHRAEEGNLCALSGRIPGFAGADESDHSGHRTELLALRDDHRSGVSEPAGAGRRQRPVSPGAGQDLSERGSGGAGGTQCRGTANLEADAHAADVPDARVCDP